MFQPNYKKGDIAMQQDIHLDDGWVCHMTVIHGDPMDLPETIRRLEHLLHQKLTYKGYSVEEIEEGLAQLK